MDEAEAQQRARAFVAGCDLSDIHKDLSVYINKARAKLKKEPLDNDESGYTLTKNGVHAITVNSLESDERQRFTICHEIAHLELELESQHSDVPSGAYAKRDRNEVLCDLFAAELLMPYHLWQAAVPKEEPSIALIEELARNFGTSFPAAASRFASLSPMPCVFVTMERGRVSYSVRSVPLRNLRAWITPRSPIPAGSVSHRLRAAGVDAEDDAVVAQDIWFEKWQQGLDMRELSRHYKHRDTTVALLWCTEEDLPEFEINRFGARVEEEEGLEELTGELAWPSRSRRR